MLMIENACIRFGKDTLFSGLNIQVNAGELVCVSGESGKGKSSLLKAVMGFVPLQEGKVVLDNIELNAQTADSVRNKISWIPQELALPSEWVKEMVQVPFGLKANRGVCFAKERLMYYFAKLGLDEELYDKRISEISGGQKQRIMLAVSAMLERRLLMVDEPTSALDAISCERVLDFFYSLTAMGTAILAVSHDRKFIEGCNRRIFI